jgi:hypothetical protein
MARKVNSSDEATSLFYIHVTVARQVKISVTFDHDFKINYKYLCNFIYKYVILNWFNEMELEI